MIHHGWSLVSDRTSGDVESMSISPVSVLRLPFVARPESPLLLSRIELVSCWWTEQINPLAPESFSVAFRLISPEGLSMFQEERTLEMNSLIHRTRVVLERSPFFSEGKYMLEVDLQGVNVARVPFIAVFDPVSIVVDKDSNIVTFEPMARPQMSDAKEDSSE
jgi:hypothetical protein